MRLLRFGKLNFRFFYALYYESLRRRGNLKFIGYFTPPPICQTQIALFVVIFVNVVLVGYRVLAAVASAVVRLPVGIRRVGIGVGVVIFLGATRYSRNARSYCARNDEYGQNFG